jgi:hypothetical protein
MLISTIPKKLLWQFLQCYQPFPSYKSEWPDYFCLQVLCSGQWPTQHLTSLTCWLFEHFCTSFTRSSGKSMLKVCGKVFN